MIIHSQANWYLKKINNRPLHVVIAFNIEKSEGIVVTLYEADGEHFEADFKTRKK